MLSRNSILFILVIAVLILLVVAAGIFLYGSQRAPVGSGSRPEVSSPLKSPTSPRPPQPPQPNSPGGPSGLTGGSGLGGLLGPLSGVLSLGSALLNPIQIIHETLWTWWQYQFWAGLFLGAAMLLSGKNLNFEFTPRWLLAGAFAPGLIAGVVVLFLGAALISRSRAP